MRKALLLLLLSLGCASLSERPMRVLVYNVHAGKDAQRVDNLERVAALIGSTRADVVLLQEVDRGTTRSGKVDQLAELERLTGMHGAFGRSLDYQGGLYGIAILSRWPIAAHETLPLHVEPPQTRAGGSVEPRVALFADLRAPGGTITVVNTHLDASAEDTWRRQEVERLLASIASRARPPFLIGGDFNATPDSAIVETLRKAGLVDAWTLCGRGQELTYPAGTPVKRIDYLFFTGTTRCASATVIDTTASDHRPVLIELAAR
jgi:endonuclease/exonuclease/phosphatase family metal-dependent hydrolase